MSETLHLALLALSWGLYAILHSLLAATPVKQAVQRRLPRHYRAYRLTYNLLAGILLIPSLWLLATFPGGMLWRWPAPLDWLADSLALLALAGFAWSLRYYDTGEFLGTRQLRDTGNAGQDEAPLTLSPLHRWVRHPWYFLGLVIIWTREMNAALLVSAVILTLYLIAGSRLEDRKLITVYGDAYRHYRGKIPGLFPLPWRRLSKREADDIQQQSHARRHAEQGFTP
jgi:protein-S-isoprenylcysteine O-methyltransferase Ste14